MAHTYKAFVHAGGGGLQIDDLEVVRVERMLRQWFRQQANGERLVKHIKVDFHNGPAAEFTLNTPPEDITHGS